ncbi:aspartate--tRNA(Asn) ligase [Candidatus Daviesbacteria bacterium RIFCSPLOWO2_01_FULL_43_38]|nr:MAG: aspartate--tRNA(Asn) ligase [Candidatus Daviesbacteria bacterium RIFCSPHIGHO2_01_FULL_43_17]OGE36797.1 MAG: aspartate--tRNA(Asn) ligase [Candidatus Daviesbacteria bacterium RIFCSPHIGHO2_12_FULL_43_11]OGE63714.1 MAG: aspartate--tRNA(Asn) ligase [Candidatus Daviesbacteria bacterium RIFCSPLOWO2_01_FULL_43_38]
MERTLILDCNEKVGGTVKVCGWVQVRRDHGKIIFLDVLDRSATIQVIAQGDMAKDLRPQDVVCIEGEVSKRPENLVNSNISTGTIELQVKSIEVLSKAEELPFDMGGKDLDLQLPTLLDYRGLTLRHPKVKAIFKVYEVVVDAFREVLKKHDFTEFQSPVIIPQTAEGGAEVFEVKYFDYKAYLAQSPQFYKQILVGVYERVFTVNKTLRAEPSVTTRHITESVTLDAEMGFIDSWTEIMDEVEYVIKHIFKRVEEECESALKLHGVTVPKVPASIPRIKMRDAQEIIYKRTGVDHRKEPDMAPDDEREICKWSLEEHGSELVFVTHYPTKKRPFYTMPDPEDPEHTLSFDLIGRGVEWLTGGQRLNDLNQLTKNANKRGVDLRKSELYLQAFRYGMPPEGGWSFGSERITQGILGLANIREATLFPRDMERVDVRLSTLK